MKDSVTIQLLGIRLFNASASALALMLMGYYQNSVTMLRDLLETGFLIDYFAIDRPKIQESALIAKSASLLIFSSSLRRLSRLSGRRGKINCSSFSITGILGSDNVSVVKFHILQEYGGTRDFN